MQSELKTNTTDSSLDERTLFRLWLQRQFTERCKKNGRYSLRAFAKSLKMDASSVSQILSGKRKLSRKSTLAVCEMLSATPKELRAFGLIQAKQGAVDEFTQLNFDTYAVISDWYHYAILELTYVNGFKANPKWIAKKLAITAEEAKSAVERLKRLGLLMEENGSLIKTSKLLTNHSVVSTSGAHKQLQKQIIEKALLAIDGCDAEEKDITSMTMAIDVQNMDRARALIKKFRRDLCALLEDGIQSRVYHLGIQLYPVSESEEKI